MLNTAQVPKRFEPIFQKAQDYASKYFKEKKEYPSKGTIEKLSAGPVHFSHSGLAFVNIYSESKPTPDENFHLIYDHPFSFESDAWEKKGKKPDFPVCVMNAGYSTGCCAAITAKEINGSLTAHSDGPGKGTVFTLELPFQNQEAAK